MPFLYGLDPSLQFPGGICRLPALGHGQALPIHPGCNYVNQNCLLPEGRIALLFLLYFFLKEIKNTKTKKFSSSFPSKHCGIFRSGYLKAKADHNFRGTQCAFEILFHIKLNLSWTDFLEVFFIRNNSPQLRDHRIRYHRRGNRNRNKASSSASSRELPTDCFGGTLLGRNHPLSRLILREIVRGHHLFQ